MTNELPSTPSTPDPYSGEPMTPSAPRSRRLGVVAALLGVGVFVLSLAASVVMGIAAAPYAEFGPSGFNIYLTIGTGDPVEDLLAGLAFLHVGLGTLIGLWAMVQGIVAIATKRGRGPGVVGLVFAFLAPGLSVVTYLSVAYATYSATQ